VASGSAVAAGLVASRPLGGASFRLSRPEGGKRRVSFLSFDADLADVF